MKILSNIASFKLIKDGIDGEDGKPGKEGKPGADGKDGVNTYLHIAYSKYENGTNETGGNAITEFPQEDSQFIGITTTDSPTRPDMANKYKWSRIKGKDGHSQYVHIRYSRFPSGVDNDGDSDMTTYPTLDSLYIGILVSDNSTASVDANDYNWAKYIGQDGKEGTPGPMIYPAGEWDPSIKYEGKELTKPFVSYKGEYYYLKAEESDVGLSPEEDYANDLGKWEYMTNFNAIITELLFADFAKLGQFIISGSYIISQNGTDNFGNPSSDYHLFPNGFKPNLVLNGRTGNFKANDGFFRGELDAKSGKIGGFEIGTYQIGSKEASIDRSHMFLSPTNFTMGRPEVKYEFTSSPTNSGLLDNAAAQYIHNTLERKSNFPEAQSYQNVGIRVVVDNSNNDIALWSEKGGIVCTSLYGIQASQLIHSSSDNVFRIYPSMGNYFYIDNSREIQYSGKFPGEHDLATVAGYFNGELPIGFAWKFTIIILNTNKRIQIQGVINPVGDNSNYDLYTGNSLEILAIKTPTKGFQYRVLSYNK